MIRVLFPVLWQLNSSIIYGQLFLNSVFRPLFLNASVWEPLVNKCVESDAPDQRLARRVVLALSR